MATMLRNVSVKEAIACFVGIQPVAPKRLPLAAAAGLRLAEDVVVRRPQPLEPLAARNGFAVAAGTLAGATRRRPKLLRDGPHPIDTGTVLPPGADAVLPMSDTLRQPRGWAAMRPVKPGDGVAAPESIAAPGLTIAPAGTRLTFPVAMACAACGVTDVLVRRPVVDVLFNAPGAPAPSDQAVGLVCGAIRGSGSEVGAVAFAGGDKAALMAAMLNGSGDIITVVGGAGDGPGDTTMEAIAEAGEAVFHGVRMTPGGSTGFGFVAGKPVFASPGGLADMVASNIVLSWHFARRAFGRPPMEPQLLRAPLSSSLPASPDRARLVFARYEDGLITPFLEEKPSATRLAQANVSILIAEGGRHRRRGESAPALRMGVSM
jgi:molybdopterin molybdotransferase